MGGMIAEDQRITRSRQYRQANRSSLSARVVTSGEQRRARSTFRDVISASIPPARLMFLRRSRIRLADCVKVSRLIWMCTRKTSASDL